MLKLAAKLILHIIPLSVCIAIVMFYATNYTFNAVSCSFDSTVSDKFTESMYVLANEPSVALYRLQEHVRRSLPELVQHKVFLLQLDVTPYSCLQH